MAQAGGRQFDTPNLADANPPDGWGGPQGDPGDSDHVTQQPMTSNPPRVRMSMASPTHIDLPKRSFTPPGVGGTFMPGGSQGATDKGTEERSSAAY
jgi:hypothetical protein